MHGDATMMTGAFTIEPTFHAKIPLRRESAELRDGMQRLCQL
jgi:hypothetical protein